MASKSERLRLAYEYKLGKDVVSKLSDKQIKKLSEYYNSLPPKEQSRVDSEIVKGGGEFLDIARGMAGMTEVQLKGDKPSTRPQGPMRPPKFKGGDIYSQRASDSEIASGQYNLAKINGAKLLGEDRYEQYKEELAAQGSIGGEQLTPQERKEGFKKRNDKIGFEQFVNKVLAKKKSATVGSSGGGGLPGKGAIVKAPGGAMQKFIQSPTNETTDKIAEEINQKLDDLISTIRAEQKLEEKSLEKERISAERDKRSKAENKLEAGFTVLQKTAQKALKPVRGIFDRIFDFIKKIIFGNILMKIIDWFGDEENQKKIQTVFRFIEDFWPALTAAVLLFGTGFGGIVRGLLGTVGKLTVGLLKQVPRFLKFFATPLGAALGIVGVTAAGLYSQATTKSNDPEAKEGQTQLDDTMDFGGTTGAPMSADMFGFGQYNKGGFVSGGGPNRDTVPAMLSPGEFVMSRGAVQRYGTSTLEAMNSMGGGTNVPLIDNSSMTYAAGGGVVNQYFRAYAKGGGMIGMSPGFKEKATDPIPGRRMGGMGAMINAPRMPKIIRESGGDNLLIAEIRESTGGTGGDSFSQQFFGQSTYQDKSQQISVNLTQKSSKNMSIAQSQIQRKPIGPPTRPTPQVEFLPLGSGSNNSDAQIPPTASQIPQFSASTSGSSKKLQTLGIG